MVSLQCSPDRLVLKGLSINGTSTGHVILERAIKHSSPMLLILQQVTPLKNPQGTVETGMFPVLLLARMPSPKAKRFDEEPSKKQFIVCGDDEQLRTAKEKFAALETTVGVLKQGLKLTYAELVILDKALNDEIMSTEPFSDPGAMRKLDLDPILRPVLYIDGVVFRGEQGFNGLLQDFDEEMVPVQHVGLLGKGAMKALLGKNHICPPKLYQDLLNSPDAATRKPMTVGRIDLLCSWIFCFRP